MDVASTTATATATAAIADADIETVETTDFSETMASSIDETTERNYRIWKKNAPFLYDYLSTNSLLWPSLTVQFFPDITHQSRDRNELLGNENGFLSTSSEVVLQRLLHGTFTMGQSVVDSISILQIPTCTNLKKQIDPEKLNYNQEKEEIELNLLQSSQNLKPKVLQKINQFGDVNKLKYMPQKPNVIASANNFGDIVIFERTRHKSFQKSIIDDTNVNKAQVCLTNNTSSLSNKKSEIFAMDWNRNKEGYLLSGDIKGVINLYDLTKYNKSSESLSQELYWENQSGVNDLEWFPTHDSLFGTGDENGSFKIYDTRVKPLESTISKTFVDSSINSISINANFSTALATGDSKGIIDIWDIRNMSKPISSLTNVHSDAITQLKWHPKFAQIIASSSSDHSVKIHDLSRSRHEHSDGSATTIFQHLGHMLGVNDFDWSFADDWMLASVADDNSLHIWKPCHQVSKSVAV
ncbi:MSI1 [Candida oxycetoniae]|uniref:MSI1 n=1 Tax=Candida oxycetoniae TaxID=497107 RepID=A0AAI9SVA4_9ASCO|nr:MSI1 [Candida oxycetoniae]KAI3403708.2 MSI1 [Candida oxycetoniae]